MTGLCILLGLPSAYAIARRPLRHRALIELLVLTPLMMPSVVLATGLGSIFIRLGLSQTIAGVVLAQTIVILPFMIRIVTATLTGRAAGSSRCGAQSRGDATRHDQARAHAARHSGLFAGALLGLHRQP